MILGIASRMKRIERSLGREMLYSMKIFLYKHKSNVESKDVGQETQKTAQVELEEIS